ncbi:MAG TPA: RsmE family RNA methyltransferase [Trueperaceae bacterium]|nr:RsmE family RNA methyltransferase [Trueperaceae bacterium]
MRVNRVLVPELGADEVVLRGPEAHHLRDVLRLKAGALVEAFDGNGNVAAGSVAAADQGGVVLTLGQPQPSEAEAQLDVTVAVALLKGDKLADVVRQCTELGVMRFVLLVTRHADVTDMSHAKLLRLQRVAEEATRQSGRARVPQVAPPTPLAALSWSGAALVADPRATGTLTGAATAGRLTLVTGPEGGLATSEVEALVARGARAVTLGPRILRAETAPLALAALALLGGGQ